jgi:hypothetical protein
VKYERREERMPIVQAGKHTIEVINTFWGTEIVKYDGEVKTKGISFLGRSYQFTVKEEDENITYEVEFKSGLWHIHFTIRRNGVAIFTS